MLLPNWESAMIISALASTALTLAASAPPSEGVQLLNDEMGEAVFTSRFIEADGHNLHVVA